MVILAMSTLSMSAMATDAREVYIESHGELATTPTHLGHVLADPNRQFERALAVSPSQWWINEKAEAKVAWRDDAYLHDPSNVTVVRVYFDFDQDQPIDVSAAMNIVATAKAMGVSFILVGHADEMGTDSYNMALSVRRALNVRSVLAENGIPTDRMRAVGKGKTVLASLLDQSLNRRVEIVVRGDKKAREAFNEAMTAKAEAERRALRARQEQSSTYGRPTYPTSPVFPGGTTPTTRQPDRNSTSRSPVTAVPGVDAPGSGLSTASGRATHQSTRPVQNYYGGSLSSPSRQPSSAIQAAPQPHAATGKSLLPPVRRSQMQGNNPFEPVEQPNE